MELAEVHGIGCVGLSNTNHWMRGGAYALQAAEAGYLGICWTNTTRLMPPWGSAEKKIGNNPMAIAVPRKEGHILLDMAMSQYSNGKLEVLNRQEKELPLPGGYDTNGELTIEPGEILASERALPIGYWKGSGLALVLDTMASVISGGQATHEIGKQGSEYAVSQVYIAINATGMMGQAVLDETVAAIIDDLHTVIPLDENESVRYPGEGMLRIRQESLEKGVLVDEAQWQALLEMVEKLALQPVHLQQDNRTKFLGEVVDHIFTRDLIVLHAQSVSLGVSDHNPLLATFALDPGKAES